MYISDINKQFKKGIITYGILSLVLAEIGVIYTSFGHGVTSAAMTFMFGYAVLGAIFYIITNRLYAMHAKPYVSRFYNISTGWLHLGVATLCTGSFIKGVLEIAGTGSNYLLIFYIVGFLWVVLSSLCTIFAISRKVQITYEETEIESIKYSKLNPIPREEL